jgi:hypothetical protein
MQIVCDSVALLKKQNPGMNFPKIVFESEDWKDCWIAPMIDHLCIAEWLLTVSILRDNLESTAWGTWSGVEQWCNCLPVSIRVWIVYFWMVNWWLRLANGFCPVPVLVLPSDSQWTGH